MKRIRPALVLLAALCVPMVLATPQANADPEDSVTPLAKANPSIPREVIARFPKHIQDNGKIYIDPSVKVDTPLLYLDGTPVEGQSAKMTASASSCNKPIIVPGTQVDYGPIVSGPCAFIGTTRTAKKTYNFYGDPAYDGTACFKARGYYDPTPTPAYDPREAWYTGGCNGGGNTYATVPWGNVVGVPAVKAKIGTPLIPWAGQFS